MCRQGHAGDFVEICAAGGMMGNRPVTPEGSWTLKILIQNVIVSLLVHHRSPLRNTAQNPANTASKASLLEHNIPARKDPLAPAITKAYLLDV